MKPSENPKMKSEVDVAGFRPPTSYAADSVMHGYEGDMQY